MQIFKFYADWCNPCKQQSRLLEGINVDITSINIEEEDNQDLVDKYGIRNLPTLIILDNDNEIARFSGLTAKEKIISAIQEYENNRK